MHRNDSLLEVRGLANFVACFLATFAVIASDTSALEPAFDYINHDNGRLLVQVSISDSLPKEVLEYIDKGVPISLEYDIELRVEKGGWFDGLSKRVVIDYKIRYDPWDMEYTIVQSSPELIVENILDDKLEALEMIMSSGPVIFIVPDSLAGYYLIASIVIKMMSFSNFKEVESWLRGEVSNLRGPAAENEPDKIGEFIFNMALKVSGIKSHSAEIRSRKFRLDQLASPDKAQTTD